MDLIIMAIFSGADVFIEIDVSYFGDCSIINGCGYGYGCGNGEGEGVGDGDGRGGGFGYGGPCCGGHGIGGIDVGEGRGGSYGGDGNGGSWESNRWIVVNAGRKEVVRWT